MTTASPSLLISERYASRWLTLLTIVMPLLGMLVLAAVLAVFMVVRQ